MEWNNNAIRLLIASLWIACACKVHAQPCDASSPPHGLGVTHIPGAGALLQWNPIAGSQGAQLRAVLPTGADVTYRLVAVEPSQFLVPDAVLSPGTYVWQVQVACSLLPPFDLSPLSDSDTFSIGPSAECPDWVSDVDGNTYATVQIGGQCWMQENLRVTRYRDGAPVPTGLDAAAWSTATSGAFAIYNGDPANLATYGLLYNWFAVTDSRGLCPVGWHVPADAELTELTQFLGGDGAAGAAMKTTGTLEAGTGLWRAPNTGATNSSGFTALPGGYRFGNGVYNHLSRSCYLWSSTERSASEAWGLKPYYRSLTAFRDYGAKQGGLSVRCLKD